MEQASETPQLMFGAIVELVDLLDEACSDPAPNAFILAIRAIAQRGFDQTSRGNVK